MNDVIYLKDFYQSDCGILSRHLLRRAIHSLWKDMHGKEIMGLGFATPYMRPYLGEAKRIVACMPAGQGVLFWPPEGPNCSLLVDETALPLPDYSFDNILLVHMLETSDNLPGVLRECWRILKGEGKLLVVVPNRSGFWNMFEKTPFGHGLPYSTSQVSKLLKNNAFETVRTQTALAFPPVESRSLLRVAAAWENTGRKWFPAFCGVNLIEAKKRLYAVTPHRAKAYARRKALVIGTPETALSHDL